VTVVLDADCPKCGTGRMQPPRYCYGKFGAGGYCPTETEGEHLHRSCRACGYTTSEPCADARVPS
jgi:predicted Zn-ribbon and HTH transcriptional regulator